jgi:dihydroceramidase
MSTRLLSAALLLLAAACAVRAGNHFVNASGGAMLTHRFEPLGNDAPGWWPVVTASIDWCERNFVISYYIAEFWNTLSSLTHVFVGLFALWQARHLEGSYKALALAIIICGAGSGAFHGTLTYLGQMWDELPMMYCMLISYLPFMTMTAPRAPHWKRYAVYLTLYGVFWTFMHSFAAFTTAFQVHFGLMLLPGLYCMYKFGLDKKLAIPNHFRHLAHYLGCLVTATVAWVIDREFCEHMHSLPHDLPNPQLHAVWHLFTGYGIAIGWMISVAIRQRALGNPVQISYWLGLVPYVSSLTKPKKGGKRPPASVLRQAGEVGSPVGGKKLE